MRAGWRQLGAWQCHSAWPAAVREFAGGGRRTTPQSTQSWAEATVFSGRSSFAPLWHTICTMLRPTATGRMCGAAGWEQEPQAALRRRESISLKESISLARTTITGILHYKALADRRARKRAPFGRRLAVRGGRGREPGGHLQLAAEQQLLLAARHSMACHGWVARRVCVKCTLVEHSVITTA